MPGLTIELPPQRTQTESNLRRWAELQGDPEMAKVDGRIETDRHGHAIMTPPPAPSHGRLQLQIGALLDRYMATGSALTECPISTADGVKAADVAWASPGCMRELGNRVCFPRAPEICVEVVSPAYTGVPLATFERGSFSAIQGSTATLRFELDRAPVAAALVSSDPARPKDAPRPHLPRPSRSSFSG